VKSASCGAGINSGHRLVFNLPYVAGTSWIAQEMTRLQSNASLVGIKVNPRPESFGQVVEQAVGNCKVAKLPCNWDMANWGSGWLFGPDFAPTGETLFKCGAIANSGGYCNPLNDALINKTLTSDNLSFMYQWENFLATQLPVIFQPTAVYRLTEIANNLKGVTPQSPTLSIEPETWYFVKHSP